MKRILIAAATFFLLTAFDSSSATFAPAGGGFRVRFPDAPTEKELPLGDLFVRTYSAAFETPGASFSIYYGDVPAERVTWLQEHGGQRFAEAMESLSRRASGSITDRHSTSLGHHRGLEIRVVGKERESRARAYVVRNRMFMAIYTCIPGYCSSGDEDAFFDSFTITR